MVAKRVHDDGTSGGSARVVGLPQVVGRSPRVLILGSMPSKQSLAHSQYYAHPRNAFWPIIDALGLAVAAAPYAERLRQTACSGVALWDSLKACVRRGSLDAAIDATTEEANDFATFFAQQPTLVAVFFNGVKAERTFQSHVIPTLDRAITNRIALERLPSTSPAHAVPLRRKVSAWRVILQSL